MELVKSLADDLTVSMINVGKALLDWRTSQGLTQNDVAEKLDVTRVAVTRWERGARPVPAARYKQIADLIGIDVSIFYDQKNAVKENPGAKFGRYGSVYPCNPTLGKVNEENSLPELVLLSSISGNSYLDILDDGASDFLPKGSIVLFDKHHSGATAIYPNALLICFLHKDGEKYPVVGKAEIDHGGRVRLSYSSHDGHRSSYRVMLSRPSNGDYGDDLELGFPVTGTIISYN